MKVIHLFFTQNVAQIFMFVDRAIDTTESLWGLIECRCRYFTNIIHNYYFCLEGPSDS